MISNLLIITKPDVVTLDNEGRGYCLILAFFQGLYSDHGRLQDKEKHKLISDAMKSVIDNEETARERLSQESKDTIASWYNKYNNFGLGIALKPGEFWNHEILEFYIHLSQLKVQIYYFREFVADKYVLLKTRKSMDRKEDHRVVPLLQLLTGHKLLITEFKDTTNLSKCLSANDLLDNTNFDSLMDASDDCTSYDGMTFISLDICKKVIVAQDASSGYASIAKSVGKNIMYIIEQLSEHYRTEYDESTHSDFYGRGKRLNDWIINNQSQPLPEELSLNLEDGIIY